MDKNALIDTLSISMGTTKSAAAEGVNALLEAMRSTLAEGESVEIHGFGKFEVKECRRARDTFWDSKSPK